MNTLTCEMCGGTDLVKQDGYFVCQSCGCKYSIEEAKKMMIEGTVHVQGTVNIDNAPNIEKYLQIARRAKSNEDWEETRVYYDKVKEMIPGCVEAVFYSAYARVRLSIVSENQNEQARAVEVLKKCFSFLDLNFLFAEEEGNTHEGGSGKWLDSVTLDILYAGLSIVFEADRRSDEEYVNLAKARLMAVELQEEWCQRLQRIIDECPEDQKDRVSLLYGVMLLHYKQALEFDDWGTVKSKIADVHRRWHQADPSHEIPLEPVATVHHTPDADTHNTPATRAISIGALLITILATLCIPPVGIVLGVKACHRSEWITGSITIALGVVMMILMVIKCVQVGRTL